MDDDLSLRDIADILKRSRALLVAIPVVCGLLAFAAVTVGPKSYASSSVVSVGNASDDTSARPEAFNARLLPKAGALSRAYAVAAPARLDELWRVSGLTVERGLDATYDDENGAITLRATAASSQLAQERARLAAQDFERYVDGLVVNVIRAQYAARLQETRLDVASDEAVLANLRDTLARTPTVLTGRGLPTARDVLESSGVDRRFAGDSDSPVNPAYTLLSVKAAEVEARLALNRARAERLARTLENRAQLLDLAREGLQVSVLAEADRPTEPTGVSAGIAAVLGVFAGVLLALVAAFAAHALRAPARRADPIAQHAD